ncbi:MAG: DNA glycosylase [Methanolinea sp.]
MPSLALDPGQPFDLDLTLSCGQVFSWEKVGDTWRGVVGGNAVRVAQRGDRLVYSGVPRRFVRDYFALDVDLPSILSEIDIDPVIGRAISRCAGLRIVRQPPWECLASFICATYASIPGIRKRVSLLREYLGEPVPGGEPGLHAFPSVDAVARAGDDLIRRCRLGYRARYLAETARILSGRPGWAEEIASLPSPEARRELQKLPGVGMKVADCVLLFSLGKGEAFPVDIWIKRAVEELYFGGQTMPIKQVYDFGKRFGKYAGYAQEFLYYYARTRRIGAPEVARTQ